MAKKHKQRKFPKYVWANAVNLVGLWRRKPVKMKHHPGQRCYYDLSNDFACPEKPGLHRYENTTTFVSHSKRDAQVWTDGAVAVMDRLKTFSTE